MDRRALTRLRLGFRFSSVCVAGRAPNVTYVFMPIGASKHCIAVMFLFPPCVEKSLDAANTSVRATRSARTLACRLDTRVETRKINGLQCVRKLSWAGHPRHVPYVPGCAIQTLDLPVSGSDNQRYSFVCHPLSSVWINGALTRTDWLFGREVKLQVKYVARWAQSFLGLADDLLTNIPVGDVTYLSSSGRFRLSVPDFAHDPLAGSPDHAGELQFWARQNRPGHCCPTESVGASGSKDRRGRPEDTKRVPLGNSLCAVYRGASSFAR